MDLGEIKVRISADMEALRTAIQKSQSQVEGLSGKLKSAGAGMTSVGKSMSLAVTAPIALMAKMGADELGEIEKANAQTAAAIKRMGAGSLVASEDVQKLAGELQNLSGQDDQLIQMGQNAILTFAGIDTATKQGKKAFEEASRVMVDFAEASGVGVDAAGKQIAKSMAAASQGVLLLPRGMKLAGEEQAKLEKFLKSGASAADKQAAVMDVLGKKVEGAAKLTATERWTVAKDQMAGVAATLVQQLMPGVQAVTDWIGRMAEKFEGLSPTTQKWVAIGLAAAAAMGPILIIAGQLATAIAALIPVFAAVGPIATAMWVAITGPVGLVVLAIAAVIAIGVLLYKNWDTIKQKVGAAWDAIKSKAVQVFGAIKQFVADHAVLIATAVMGPIGGLVVWTIKNWDAIKSGAATAWRAIKTTIKDLVSDIPGAVSGAMSGLIDLMAGIGSRAGSALANAIRAAVNSIISKWNALEFPGLEVKGQTVIPSVGTPNLPLMARGGVTNGPAIAGEAGPEAVIPLGGSAQNRADASRVMGQLGMGGTTINVYSLTGYDPAIQQAVASAVSGGYTQGANADVLYSGRL